MKQFIATLTLTVVLLSAYGQKRIYLLDQGKVETATKSQSKYFNSKVDSLEYFFVEANSFKQMQGIKLGEVAHGEAVFYDEVGNIIEQGEFKKGLKHGRWTRWDISGQIIEVTNWKNGLKHGAYKRIYGPQKIESGQWKKNTKVGIWVYKENGEIINSKNYSPRKTKKKKIKKKNRLKRVKFEEVEKTKEESQPAKEEETTKRN